MKIACNKCGVEKELCIENFQPRKTRSKNGFRASCRVCTKRPCQYIPQQGHKKQRKNLKYRYGITFEQYTAMLAAQAGGCAICGKSEKLRVDHCHATGKVRGILCHGCNIGLGVFLDSPELLRLAAAYVAGSHVSKI